MGFARSPESRVNRAFAYPDFLSYPDRPATGLTCRAGPGLITMFGSKVTDVV